jgi:hypothetical protein
MKQQQEEAAAAAAAAGVAQQGGVKEEEVKNEPSVAETPGEAISMEMEGPGAAKGIGQHAAAAAVGAEGPAAMDVDGEPRSEVLPEALGVSVPTGTGAEDVSGTNAAAGAGMDGVRAAAGEPAAGTAGPPTAPQAPAPPAIPTYRPACMWVLLSPVNSSGASGGPVAVPLHIDPALPDYIVQAANYETRMRKEWQPGDRFRMYFGGKLGTKVGGAYYKGNILKVHADIKEGETQPDPWESIEVVWDSEDGSSQHRVSYLSFRTGAGNPSS